MCSPRSCGSWRRSALVLVLGSAALSALFGCGSAESAPVARVTGTPPAAPATTANPRMSDRAPAAGALASDAGERELTVAEAKKALVVRDEPTPLGHGSALPGPCVDWTRGIERLDVEPTASDDDVRASLVERENRADPAGFDVDGDGVADVSVVTGAVDVLTTSDVFVVRGRCGYLVGSFSSYAGVKVLRRASHGLFDLATREAVPALGLHVYEITYRYDGHLYRQVSRRVAHDPRGALRTGPSLD